jgi:hypothetical protein
MQNYTCLNCGEPQVESQKFCGQCGQTYDIHRFTFKHFFHEAFHAFTHTDKGIFHLLKCLAIKPGTTAREYIRGRRKYYFNPFTFFLILMTIFVLSNNLFKKDIVLRQPEAAVLNRIPTEEGKKRYVTMMERSNDASVFFRKHGNVAAMIAVPFISFFTWLAFRRRGFNYAEHLTANMMFVAFSNLIFTLIVYPLFGYLSAGKIPLWATGLAMTLQALYFGWSLNGFLQLNNSRQRVKSFIISLIAVILWAAFSLTMMAVYIYRSWDFYQFFKYMGR